MTQTQRSELSQILVTNFRFLLQTALAATVIAGCAPSPPNLEYSGVTSKGAIELFNRADTNEKRETIIHDLETRRRGGFDWATLWRGLTKKTFAKFTPAQQTRLLSLAKEDCSERGFYEFSVLVLRLRRGINLASGPNRVCARPLDEKVFGEFAAEIKRHPRDRRAGELAGLVVSQHSLLGDTDRARVLEVLAADEWEPLLENLFETGRGDLAVQLAEIHQKEFGGMGFLDQLIVSWLKHPEQFERVLNTNHLSDVLRLLTVDASLKERTGDVTAEQWAAALMVLASKFIKNSKAYELTKSALPERLQMVRAMHVLPERALHPPSFMAQLVAMELVLRGLEMSIDQSLYRDGLLVADNSNLFMLWIGRRLGKTWRAQDDESLERAPAATRLELALKKKLRLWAETDPQRLRVGLHDYCRWMRTEGMENYLAENFNWSMTTLPGCILLAKKEPGATLVLKSEEPLMMAFDSIVLTDGLNLELETPRFDGSFIDGSDIKQPPTPVTVPTPETDDAVALPILLGIRQSDPTVLFGAGTYSFVYHHTLRRAKPGGVAPVEPRTGYPSGSLTVHVRDSHSREPKFTSIGGPGQRPSPARAGGRGSHSTIDWAGLSRQLTQTRSTDPSPAAQPMPLASPTWRVIQRLFDHAERDPDHLIKVYLDTETMFKFMTPEQRSKAQVACPAGPSDNDCWHEMAKQAARSLWAEHEAACPLIGEHHVCADEVLDQINPRLNSSGFTEPAGEPGPVGSWGRHGSDGILDIVLHW